MINRLQTAAELHGLPAPGNVVKAKVTRWKTTKTYQFDCCVTTKEWGRHICGDLLLEMCEEFFWILHGIWISGERKKLSVIIEEGKEKHYLMRANRFCDFESKTPARKRAALLLRCMQHANPVQVDEFVKIINQKSYHTTRMRSFRRKSELDANTEELWN